MSSTDHPHFLTILSNIAQDHDPERGDGLGSRVAAGIVHKGEFISFGLNSYRKSHPFQKRYQKNKHAIYWHAECHAIFNALKRYDPATLAKSTLYIARIKEWDEDKRRLVWGIAEPCEGCLRAIKDYQIPQTVYTLDHLPDDSQQYAVVQH